MMMMMMMMMQISPLAVNQSPFVDVKFYLAVRGEITNQLI